MPAKHAKTEKAAVRTAQVGSSGLNLRQVKNGQPPSTNELWDEEDTKFFQPYFDRLPGKKPQA